MLKLFVICMLVVCATTAFAADSLYRYEGGARQYYPVDTTRILIKWKPIAVSFDQSGFLTPYSSISATSYVPNAADQYFMHYLIGSVVLPV
jgi:hypothetical protein